MGDAVRQSCPKLMDIYCIFWTVGAGHTHALILMSPPPSCCSLLFYSFLLYLIFGCICRVSAVVSAVKWWRGRVTLIRRDSLGAARPPHVSTIGSLLRHGGSSNTRQWTTTASPVHLDSWKSYLLTSSKSVKQHLNQELYFWSSSDWNLAETSCLHTEFCSWIHWFNGFRNRVVFTCLLSLFKLNLVLNRVLICGLNYEHLIQIRI